MLDTGLLIRPVLCVADWCCNRHMNAYRVLQSNTWQMADSFVKRLAGGEIGEECITAEGLQAPYQCISLLWSDNLEKARKKPGRNTRVWPGNRKFAHLFSTLAQPSWLNIPKAIYFFFHKRLLLWTKELHRRNTEAFSEWEICSRQKSTGSCSVKSVTKKRQKINFFYWDFYSLSRNSHGIKTNKYFKPELLSPGI